MKSSQPLTKLISWLALLCMLSSASVHAATVTRHAETASGLQGWLISDGNIEIQLNPLARDQVRAFYLARGFSDAVVQQIESSCVFQAVMSNVSDSAVGLSVGVDLSKWQIITAAGESPLTTKDSWLQKWTEMGASDVSRLAFRWATFPWVQSYVQSGDYGWGMILLGQGLAETFSVTAHWTVGNDPQSQAIEDLSCPD